MPVMTINTTAPQAQRLAVAFGRELGLGRNATADEIKAAVITYLRRVVILQERGIAEAQITPPSVFDPT